MEGPGKDVRGRSLSSPEAGRAPSRLPRLLRGIVNIEPEETTAALLSGLYFFLLMTSYFILRPIRDELAVADGVSKLPWLYTGTLAATLVCNPLLSAIVVRFRVRQFIAIAYQFFAINLVVFYVLARVLGASRALWLGRIFFIWVSVFNLFVTSLFWSFMADTFQNAQAKRLFGFIGLGGTLGSILGSGITALLARRLGTQALLLLSAGLLEGVLTIVWFFPRGSGGSGRSTETSPIGGSTWAGMVHVARSAYLSGIAVFIMLYTIGSTALYFEQTDVVGKFFASRELRTEFLAKMEFATQVLTATTQTFFTARIIRWIGLAATLAVTPLLSALGFSFLAAGRLGLPLLATFAIFSVIRRASNFSIGHPSVEILYTVVSREDKFKAKTFIGTFLYRAADQLGAWGYAILAWVGLSLSGISVVAMASSLALLSLGVWLGRKERALAQIQ